MPTVTLRDQQWISWFILYHFSRSKQKWHLPHSFKVLLQIYWRIDTVLTQEHIYARKNEKVLKKQNKTKMTEGNKEETNRRNKGILQAFDTCFILYQIVRIFSVVFFVLFFFNESRQKRCCPDLYFDCWSEQCEHIRAYLKMLSGSQSLALFGDSRQLGFCGVRRDNAIKMKRWIKREKRA